MYSLKVQTTILFDKKITDSIFLSSYSQEYPDYFLRNSQVSNDNYYDLQMDANHDWFWVALSNGLSNSCVFTLHKLFSCQTFHDWHDSNVVLFIVSLCSFYSFLIFIYKS